MKKPSARLVAVCLSLVFASLAAGCAFRTQIALGLMDRGLSRNMGSTLLDKLPDGLHVAICGAGSPLPDPKRSGPCTAVIAGKRLFIVDSGAGSTRVLARIRIPAAAIEAILLTHFHSDHIDGLGELQLQRWAGGHREPVPLYGPSGVEEIVRGINAAYSQSRASRVVHHGRDLMNPAGAGAVARPFRTPAERQEMLVLEDETLRITAFRVNHEPVEPAVGYRFEYGGRSLVISGDTAKSENLAHFSRGADLLIHDSLSPRLLERITLAAHTAGNETVEQITKDILDYHATPVEAAETAESAGVRFLLFSHVVPPLPIAILEGVFLEGVNEVYTGDYKIARDGTLIRLDAGSDSIHVEELL